MKIRSLIRKQLLKAGYDLVRHNISNNYRLRRMNIIASHNIDLIFDIGANIGQYSFFMRKNGYKGRIVSFEPQSQAFDKLQEVASRDPQWQVSNIALGDTDSESILNIAGNNNSNSIRQMMPSHYKHAPETAYIGNEKITVRKLDTIIGNYCSDNDKLFLKLDTQGYEKNIIDGAKESLNKIIGIQLEMSVIELYKDEFLLPEMINFLSQKGYTLWSLEPGFVSRITGQLLQYDGIFFKE